MTAYTPRKRKQPKKMQNCIKTSIGSSAERESPEEGESFFGQGPGCPKGAEDCEHFKHNELSIAGKVTLPCLGKEGRLSGIPASSTVCSSQELISPASRDGVSDLQVVFR